MRLTLQIASCFWLVFIAQFSTFAQKDSSLYSSIQAALKEEALTGAVWSYIDSSGEIITGAAGVKYSKTKEPLRPESKVHVGSIAKTLLAVGVLRLVSQGKISLEDPVSTYLPDIEFVNPWEDQSPVRVRHLLNHTSGLSDIRLWQIFSQKAQPDDPLKLAFTKNKDLLTIYARPGDFFSYSNMGYTLLGMIIESSTGQRYESYLDENMLKPLGMEKSTFFYVSQEGKYRDLHLAYGHLDGGQPAPALPVYLRPAAQFTTTARDIGRFAKFLLNEGKIGGGFFVDPALIRQMGRPQHTLAMRNGLDKGYGFGAATRDRHGVIGKAHSGNIMGYHAMFYWFPDHRTAFFISHNMDSESADYEKFNRILIDYLGLSSALPQIEPKVLLEMNDWNGYFIPRISKVSPFAYLDFISGFVKIEVKDNAIVLNPFMNEPKILHHLGENRFQAEDKMEGSHVGLIDEKGDLILTDGIANLKKINSLSLGLNWISALAGILSLVGMVILSVLSPSNHFFKSSPRPFFFPVLGLFTILTSIPFFVFQPFVALGDLTVAAFLVFLGTAWFPLGLILGGLQILRQNSWSRTNKISLTLILLALQWMIVLLFWSILPFRLWV